MMIFAPLGWDPEANAAVLWRHPRGCLRCLPAAPRDPNIPELLWVIYWSVAGRDPTAEEREANRTEPGDVRELFALLDHIARRKVGLSLSGSTSDDGVLFIGYATTNGWRLQVTYWHDPRAGLRGGWERHLSAAVNPRGEHVALVPGLEQSWAQIRDMFPEPFRSRT